MHMRMRYACSAEEINPMCTKNNRDMINRHAKAVLDLVPSSIIPFRELGRQKRWHEVLVSPPCSQLAEQGREGESFQPLWSSRSCCYAKQGQAGNCLHATKQRKRMIQCLSVPPLEGLFVCRICQPRRSKTGK